MTACTGSINEETPRIPPPPPAHQAPPPPPPLPPAVRRAAHPAAGRQCWALSGPSSPAVLAATASGCLAPLQPHIPFQKRPRILLLLLLFYYLLLFFIYLTFILPKNIITCWVFEEKAGAPLLLTNLHQALLLPDSSLPLNVFPRLGKLSSCSLSGLCCFQLIHRANIKNVYSWSNCFSFSWVSL